MQVVWLLQSNTTMPTGDKALLPDARFLLRCLLTVTQLQLGPAAWHCAGPMLVLIADLQAKWSLATLMWDQVGILTNQCIMKLRAPGFAQVHRAAESGVSPPALWGDLQKCAGPSPSRYSPIAACHTRRGPALTVHRKDKPGKQEEESLAHELRCWPNLPQADQIHLIALKVHRKYYSEPSRAPQQWASRHDQLVQADKGLPKQELPATMLSMDYTRVWYTDNVCVDSDAQARHSAVHLVLAASGSSWLPAPGACPFNKSRPPADPVLVYLNDSEKGSRPSVKPA
ncbi:TPA: hypothetical protein ACH3X2_010575 [Trebouxia sp. C0005]